MSAPAPTDALALALDAGRRPAIVGLAGGFTALFLAELARARAGRTLVVVVPDPAQAGLLEDGLGFFLGQPPAVFPLLDHVPFQGMSPARQQVMERVTTLFRLAGAGQPGARPAVVIVPAAALLDRVPPRALFRETGFEARAGADLDLDPLVEFLVATGHHRVPQAEDPGTFAVRGGIVDVWSPLYPEPIRLELFGDECERIRTFDPATQASRDQKLASVRFGPVRDIVFSDAAIALAKGRLGALADDRHLPTSRKRAMLADLESKVLGVGMEDLLPAFHATLEPVFAHLADATWIVSDPAACITALADRWDDLRTRAARAATREGELHYPIDALYLDADLASGALSERTAATLEPFALFDPTTIQRPVFQYRIEDQRELRKDIEQRSTTGESHVLTGLVARIRAWRDEGLAVVATAHSAGGIERIRALLQGYGLRHETHTAPFSLADVPAFAASPHELHLVIGTPGQGFVARERHLVVVDESEILGKPPRARRKTRKVPPEQLLQSWRDLQPGDLVVHVQHGVGRYLGLTRSAPAATTGGLESDFLELEYADKNKLFVPVEKLHLVSKHQGGEGAPALDKLGGAGTVAWQKTRSRIKKAVRNIAGQLVKLYAEREASPGFAFSPPDELYHRFEAAFPYEETPDQTAAIEETLADMQRARPMDRLVCGDVGFGKTEVAIRAAMKAVLDGKQVAVLVPTQVLAEQHRMTFMRRFEGFPVTIESLSSMRSSARQKEIVAATALGGVDVLIGTHRILSKDVVFKDLGLVVVDEEHRFGVAHKEHLKQLRTSVDVMTLTATPIPRTLHLSMIGLRDMSLIQTPPIDRVPIQTFVAQPSDEVLTEAIRRELGRGGQVFFVHPRVADGAGPGIEKMAEQIARLVPEARIAVGHGQMGEGQLEKVMMRFITGEANVLVSTTIVESGIDIPNANTILINRADVFGLAQLYQLRGRVGRSPTRAYCYLLVPAPDALAGDAGSRLAAIQQFSELGSGFAVASHDLDIRGAGDILGADQAGNIDAVGYDAYMDLLQESIGEIRAEQAGETPEPELDPELKITIHARIPETWLPETALRLRLYRAFANARSTDEVARLLAGAVDRYGAPPDPVRNLADLMTLKLEAKAMRIASISLGKDAMVLGLAPPTPQSVLQPAVVMGLVAARPGWRITPEGRIVVPVTASQAARGPQFVRESLLAIANFASSFGRSAPARATPGEIHARDAQAPPHDPRRPPGGGDHGLRQVRGTDQRGPARRVFDPGPRERGGPRKRPG
ncbi:MAG: transcription-repair coupling factor [Myxococcota bacterium]